MYDSDFLGYELLDFGRGRRLERFGEWVLDRESPFAGAQPPAFAELWKTSDWRFDIGTGRVGTWREGNGTRGDGNERLASNTTGNLAEIPAAWEIGRPPLRLELRRTEFGHTGIFPEQIPVWDRIDRFISQWVTAKTNPIRVLNLFAYTGGATLAAAAAGAAVTHVDSAASTVARARRNAELSGLTTAPIRWITEDVRRFVRREIVRGAKYEVVILDPPAYGHGKRGQTWRIGVDLTPLLADCAKLTAGTLRMVVLSAHSPGYDSRRLSGELRRAFGEMGRIETRALAMERSRIRLVPERFKGRRWLDAGELAILEQ